ncbi:MAG TPA: hypothetical protein VGM75_32810 [Pseudonocardiaceae bacterium]
MSNVIINANRTQGYLLSEESLMSAELLVDLRPQAECARMVGAGWDQISGIAKQTPKFEQHVRPVVAEGTTGIPPSAHRDAFD